MKIDRMRHLAQKGKMSRREFVQLALAAGVTVATAEVMFVEAVRAEPKKGGFFRAAVGHGETTDSLDPALWGNSHEANVGFMIASMLTEIDQKNSVVPGLAESWEASDGAKKWVFKLRKGVTFHNGKTLDSGDVVATYNHHRNPDAKSAVKSVLDQVEDVKADGPDTVIFTLKSGSADFPYVASDYHLPIFAAKDDKIDWQSGIGTGPFVLERYEPGVTAKLKRNPNFFRNDGPYFDEVELLSVVDVAARTAALQTGDIHYIDRCDLKTISLLEQNPDLKITNVTGFAHYVVPMDVRVAPFDNPDIRNALKFAIDREEILKKVLLGYGQAGNDTPLAPSIKFATNPEPVHKYDPDKVKFHLGKAGVTSLKVDLSTADTAFAGAVDAALLMKEQAAKHGIEINVVKEANDGYWSNVWMKKPWCFSYWQGRPTADWMLTTAYAADAEWNDTAWKNPKFNELLVAARAETDEAKRAAAYAEMQTILHDDGGIIVLMFNNYVSAHSAKVAHGDLNSNFDMDGGYLYSRWWFA
ncbi:MAG: ABC transporter substrate-binding protein [Hyphomicrobiaceae bacterium]